MHSFNTLEKQLDIPIFSTFQNEFSKIFRHFETDIIFCAKKTYKFK